MKQHTPSLSGKEAHTLSEELRESDRLPEALQTIEIALVEYQKERNYAGFAKALQSRLLIYKHLFLLTHDRVFAILAKQDALASLSIAREHSLREILSSCYFRMGEAENLFKNYKKASVYFKKAVDIYGKADAEKGDYRYHLGEALYRSGKKNEGKNAVLKGLEEIRTYREKTDSFLLHVWESGCLMRLAELVWTEEPEKARKYMEEAQKIIDLDTRLVIRKRQIAKLSEKIRKHS